MMCLSWTYGNGFDAPSKCGRDRVLPEVMMEWKARRIWRDFVGGASIDVSVNITTYPKLMVPLIAACAGPCRTS